MSSSRRGPFKIGRTKQQISSKNVLLGTRDQLDDDRYDGYSDVEDEQGPTSAATTHKINSKANRATRRGRRASAVQMIIQQGNDGVGLNANSTVSGVNNQSSHSSAGANNVHANKSESNSADDQGNMSLDSLSNLKKLASRPNASLAELLSAAEADVAMHTNLINPLESEQKRQERHSRQLEREVALRELKSQADHILAATSACTSGGMHLTEKLDYWERALQLHVEIDGGMNGGPVNIDALTLLAKLVDACNKENDLSTSLSEAYKMVMKLVQSTLSAAQDAEDEIIEAEAAYRIKLEAHSRFMQKISDDMDLLYARFRTDGSAAVKIGQQLEMAEAKRRQCENASVLIRRWWLMENLAEKDAMESINVEDEMSGKIEAADCQLDPLFTQPENSLEAARALKALRNVVKSSTLNSLTESDNGSPSTDIVAVENDVMLKTKRRFDLASKLIERISSALESRLLSSYLAVYNQGGTYDFSTKSDFKHGRLDWPTLRQLAEALYNFENGRNLQNAYVNQVVVSRFPEFAKFSGPVISTSGSGDANEESDDDEYSVADDSEYDMDETRSKLSTLFHRVSEVCKAEFALIAHVFNFSEFSLVGGDKNQANLSSTSVETRPLQVSRALLHRIISDSRGGLHTRIEELLFNIKGDSAFDVGSKKLDTFVVIHEKVSGLFMLLREAVERYLVVKKSHESASGMASKASMASSALLHFLNSQEITLAKGQRKGYLNLELRLLHHECCSLLEKGGAMLSKPASGSSNSFWSSRRQKNMNENASNDEYQAPRMEISNEAFLEVGGCKSLLDTILKPSVLRQPLIYAAESLARAQLMFGGGESGNLVDHETRSKAIISIYNQMCNFFGHSYIYPILDILRDVLDVNPPSTSPDFGRGEDVQPHDLGVEGGFWLALERIHSAAKAFDRELWAEKKEGSARVWELLAKTGNHSNLALAKEWRAIFFRELEDRGEAAILKALETLSAHVQWIFVSGGEGHFWKSSQGGGPYAIPSGTSLQDSTSPAVKYLTRSLRDQFVQVQSALSPSSLSAFWTALSMRLYDILIARLLQHYQVSTVGAIMLSRDVESLRSVSMLAGSCHTHWDILRELLTLYMTPPDALKTILVGPDGELHSTKGLFHRAGQEQSLIFMSRRVDFRVKTNIGFKKSEWAIQLLDDLGVKDPSDGNVKVALYSAAQRRVK